MWDKVEGPNIRGYNDAPILRIIGEIFQRSRTVPATLAARHDDVSFSVALGGMGYGPGCTRAVALH